MFSFNFSNYIKILHDYKSKWWWSEKRKLLIIFVVASTAPQQQHYILAYSVRLSEFDDNMVQHYIRWQCREKKRNWRDEVYLYPEICHVSWSLSKNYLRLSAPQKPKIKTEFLTRKNLFSVFSHLFYTANPCLYSYCTTMQKKNERKLEKKIP